MTSNRNIALGVIVLGLVIIFAGVLSQHPAQTQSVVSPIATTTNPNPVVTTVPATTTGKIIVPITPPAHSGVLGTVMLGPTCPVQRIPPDPTCADKPYQTSISIFKTNNPTHVVVQTSSDSSGTFKATLPPGAYTIQAGPGKGVFLPRCSPVQVVVTSSSYATTTIQCDTGIR